jgi:hypothetical protein
MFTPLYPAPFAVPCYDVRVLTFASVRRGAVVVQATKEDGNGND